VNSNSCKSSLVVELPATALPSVSKLVQVVTKMGAAIAIAAVIETSSLGNAVPQADQLRGVAEAVMTVDVATTMRRAAGNLHGQAAEAAAEIVTATVALLVVLLAAQLLGSRGLQVEPLLAILAMAQFLAPVTATQ
jgi:hypothetical protein